jgi:hypothetical protein
VLHTQPLHNLKAPDFGHLNVEEHEIHGFRLQVRNGLVTVLALRDDMDVFVFGKQGSQKIPCQRLIIDDYGPKRHAIARSYGI